MAAGRLFWLGPSTEVSQIGVSQTATQGAIGAVSSGAGHSVALAFGLSSFRSGVSTSTAISLSEGVGTIASIGTAIAANALVPSNFGGLNPDGADETCKCPK